MREKVQNYLKNLRDAEEELLFWDYKVISVEKDLENYLNQEEPNDNDIRKTE